MIQIFKMEMGNDPLQASVYLGGKPHMLIKVCKKEKASSSYPVVHVATEQGNKKEDRDSKLYEYLGTLRAEDNEKVFDGRKIVRQAIAHEIAGFLKPGMNIRVLWAEKEFSFSMTEKTEAAIETIAQALNKAITEEKSNEVIVVSVKKEDPDASFKQFVDFLHDITGDSPEAEKKATQEKEEAKEASEASEKATEPTLEQQPSMGGDLANHVVVEIKGLVRIALPQQLVIQALNDPQKTTAVVKRFVHAIFE